MIIGKQMPQIPPALSLSHRHNWRMTTDSVAEAKDQPA